MQEHTRIQRQLQKLRQQCIKQYLETKLQAISSKQVIHEVLLGFLQSNNQQFLQNISKNIQEVKHANCLLKEQLKTIKQEQANMMQPKIDQSKKSQNEDQQFMIRKIQQQNTKLLVQIQAQSIQYNKKMLEIIQQVQRITLSKTVVQNSLMDSIKSNKLLQMQQQKLKFHISSLIQDSQYKQTSFNQKLIHFQNCLKKAEKQKLQMSLEYCSDIQRLQQAISLLEQKNSNNKTAYEQQILRLSQIENLLKQQNGRLNVELADQLQNGKQAQSTNTQLNQLICALQSKSSNLQSQRNHLSQNYQKASQTLQNYKKQNQYLLVQLEKINQKYEQFCQKTVQNQKQQKNRYQNLQRNMKNQIDQLNLQKQKNSCIFSKELNSLRQQNDLLVKTKTIQQQLLQQQTMKHKSIEQEMSRISNLLQKNMEQNVMLIDYNNIQNEQLEKTENQINNLRINQQASRKIIERYESQISQMQNSIVELTNEQKANQQKQKQLEQSLQLQKQKQKYYHLYLQEIGFLKRQLQKYQPSKHQYYYDIETQDQSTKLYRKSNIYIKTEQIAAETKKLKVQNQVLKNQLRSLVELYKEQTSKNTAYLVNLIYNKCLQFVYNSNKQQTQKESPKNHKLNNTFDKTVPKHKESCSYSEIKQNLKHIQQKYYHANQENTFFTSYIDNILKKQ